MDDDVLLWVTCVRRTYYVLLETIEAQQYKKTKRIFAVQVLAQEEGPGTQLSIYLLERSIVSAVSTVHSPRGTRGQDNPQNYCPQPERNYGTYSI